MKKTKIYRSLIVLFLLAMLFGSSAAYSILATEIMFAIAAVMAVTIVILMFIRSKFKSKK